MAIQLNIILNGREIRIFTSDPDISSQEELRAILIDPKFRMWLEKVQHLKIVAIEILKVSKFGPKVGFVYMNMKVDEKTTDKGEYTNNFVFMRGDAVACYIEITEQETQNKYVVFTKQLRVPVGHICVEIPAGMMDD